MKQMVTCKRTKVIVPDSAHGTNPASATVAGFETITVKSNEDGLVDLEDLRRVVGEDTAALNADKSEYTWSYLKKIFLKWLKLFMVPAENFTMMEQT